MASGGFKRKWGLSLILVSRILGTIAAAFLAAMVLLTVADVVLRSLFGYPIRGMLELIELGLACAVFLGLPAVFLRRGHLVVDVIDQLAPPSLVRLLDLVGAVVSFGVLAVTQGACDIGPRQPSPDAASIPIDAVPDAGIEVDAYYDYDSGVPIYAAAPTPDGGTPTQG